MYDNNIIDNLFEE